MFWFSSVGRWSMRILEETEFEIEDITWRIVLRRFSFFSKSLFILEERQKNTSTRHYHPIHEIQIIIHLTNIEYKRSFPWSSNQIDISSSRRTESTTICKSSIWKILRWIRELNVCHQIRDKDECRTTPRGVLEAALRSSLHIHIEEENISGQRLPPRQPSVKVDE